MKPLIGVVADTRPDGKHTAHSVHRKYLDAIAGGAGGIPLILPAHIDTPGGPWSDPDDAGQILSLLDALFLTGAVSNIEPHRYGAELADPNSPADPARDDVTLRLVREAVRRGLPVLGVCRGCQEINVALGGTLHQKVQEVPGFADHRERKDLSLEAQYAPAHSIDFAPGGFLATISGQASATVNSLHGQGVDRLAPGLTVEATAPDGLIEAFRLDDHDRFVFGAQWHPEWQFRDNPLSVAIFRAFGDASRAHRKARATEPRLAA